MTTTTYKTIHEQIFDQVIALVPDLFNLSIQDQLESEILMDAFLPHPYWNCLYLCVSQKTDESITIMLFPRSYDCPDGSLFFGYENFLMKIKIYPHSCQAEIIALNDGDGLFREWGDNEDERQELDNRYLLLILKEFIQKGHQLKKHH